MNELQTLGDICKELGIERNTPTPTIRDITVQDFRTTGELPEGVRDHVSLFIRNNGLVFQCAVRADDLLEAYSVEDGIIICTDGLGASHEIDCDTFIIGS